MKRLCFILVLASSSQALAQDYEKLLTTLDPRVFAPGSDDAKAAPALFGKMLRTLCDRVNRDDVVAWKSLAAKNNKAEWEQFAASSIAALKRSIGTLPALTARRIPSHISKTLSGDGFAIDNLVYESRPGLWVTANLYRPEPPRKPGPGIVIVHSHHNPKTEGELQDMGIMWARAGCHVLIPDQLGHGERRQHPFVDKASFPNSFKVGRQDYYFRYNLGMQLHLVGESLIGWMANDMIAGVTLLLSKPGVDPERIILLGSVAGGGDPAAVTAALDKRITCLVPFNFGGPQPESKYPLPDNAEETFDYMGGGSWESTRNLAFSAAGGWRDAKRRAEGRFLPWTIVAAIAPRHLIHAHEFSWDGERDPVWKRYQRIWSWYGAQNNLAIAHGKGTLSGKPPEASHCNNIGPEHRSMIHSLFEKWFGIKADETGVKAMRRPAADLQCWSPDLKDKLKPKLVHALALEMWNDGIAGAIRRPEDRPAIDHSEVVQPEDCRVLLDRMDEASGEIAVRRVVLEGTRFGTRIPILILSPKEKNDGRTVIAIGPQGKQPLLTAQRAAMAEILRKGISVCLPDLPGTGEVGASSSRSRTSLATEHSSTVQMLGGTIDGLHIIDLCSVVWFLTQDAETSKRSFRYCIWSEADVPVNGPNDVIETPHDAEPAPKIGAPTVWAGAPLAWVWSQGETQVLRDTRGVMSRGNLLNFRSALESPFQHLPHQVMDVPAIWFDFRECAFRAVDAKFNKVGATPLRFEAMIDAQNRRVRQAEIDETFAPLRKQTKNHDIITAVEARSTPEELARWFVERLK